MDGLDGSPYGAKKGESGLDLNKTYKKNVGQTRGISFSFMLSYQELKTKLKCQT